MKPSEFIEKYKLIPKNLRLYFIKFFQFIQHTQETYTSQDHFEIIKDCFNTLEIYENLHKQDNFTFLKNMLVDEVYAGNNVCYENISKRLLYCLYLERKYMDFENGFYEFIRKNSYKKVLNEIKDLIAYLPGNIGYEEAMERFQISQMKICVL